MEAITLHRLAAIVGGELRNSPDPAVEIETVTVHSARIQSGSLFIALPGTRCDGHEHVAAALRTGAVAAVVAAPQVELLSEVAGPLVVVPNPLIALQQLAAWWRERLTGVVIAIVGSHGKTVTKDAVLALAGGHLAVYASPGSFNSQLGVALAMLDCPRDADVAVIEAAATEPGEMARLRGMIRPHHVVFTNLRSRHEQAFGGRETHARELLCIAGHLPAGGWILLGEDDAMVRTLASETGARVLVSGASIGLPAFRLQDRLRSGLLLEVSFGSDRHETVIGTPSEDILTDVELAICAVGLLGVEREQILSVLDEYVPTSTRTEVWRSPWGYSVVGDIATANPLTFASAVRTANRLQETSGGRLYVVLADPLVDARDEAPAQLAEVIAASGAAAVVALDAATPRAIVESLASHRPSIQAELFASLDQIRGALATTLTAQDVILVQVPRGTPTPDGWLQLIEPMAATRLYIDQAAIESNVAAFRRLIGSRTRLLGVVKAQAYGTNPTQVALCLQESGADWLGVATTDEGMALRRHSIVNIPILVFLPQPTDIERMVARQLTPLVYSLDMLGAVIAYASAVRRPVRIHLEVDSGMHRTGLAPAEAQAALRRIRQEDWIQLEGLMTHLGCADDPADDPLTLEQLARFQKVSSAVDELGFTGVIRHAAATAATIRFPHARFDMVRIGIGLYGIQLSDATSAGINLTPALSLVSRIIEVHTLDKGERVGYGGRYAAPRDGSRVGVIPAGYFDCVPRAFSKQRRVWVDGEQASIIGNVSMDSMTVDVSSIPTATVGSDVLIYGQHSGATIPIEEAAANMDTVPYELLTRIGPRVQRIFTRH